MDGKSRRRFMMGRKTHITEVKKEVVEEEYLQEQLDEPCSDSEDQMTIPQYFASKGKPIHPSPSFEVMSMDRSRGPLTRSKTRTKCPVFMVDNALQKGPWGTGSRILQKFRMDNNNFEVPSSVKERAEEVRANLDPQFPSFIKMMLRSHLTKGFWLGLPAGFCKMYMPKHDEVCILEDEGGEQYKAKFLAGKMGLSGGWKGFASAHNLLEGDAVVYQLVGTCKLKVFTVRATLGEVDGALGLLQLDNNLSGRKSAVDTLKLDGLEKEEVSKEKDMRTNIKLYSDDAECCGRSTSFVDFENFNIIVNDHILDFQIPIHMRLKYYELCRAQKSYLHVGLIKTISGTLAAGIISDTVKIANAIKSSNISTPNSDFALWDKTLAGFELLGIEVGFLRARISKLAGLVAQSGDTTFKEAQANKLEYNGCRRKR